MTSPTRPTRPVRPAEPAQDDRPVAVGPARVGRRTKDLIKRLQPGDVAVIDHENLDRVAAEGLIEARIAAVINAAACISGRYPNVGPLLLAAAGIAVLDEAGPDVMALREGVALRLEAGSVFVGSQLVAKGERQTLQSLEAQYETAKGSMGDELARFAENTLEYLHRERHLALEPAKIPETVVDVRGRHVLIVVRGADYKDDLAHLRSYVVEMQPVLIGVDGGADALLEQKLKPDIIIGDFDSVSDRALATGAELIVHAFPDGRAPGAARLEHAGLSYLKLESAGTSEDVAMLLAYEKGAELIVAVGTHASMVDFLDKGREGMASTFHTRLKVGPILVDAKGVNQLYSGRLRKRDLMFFLVAAMLAFAVIAIMVVPPVYWNSLRVILKEWWRTVTH
jgi:uncharacterized membrane-anchored protein